MDVADLEEKFGAIAETALKQVHELNVSPEQRLVGLRVLHEHIESALMELEDELLDEMGDTDV